MAPSRASSESGRCVFMFGKKKLASELKLKPLPENYPISYQYHSDFFHFPKYPSPPSLFLHSGSPPSLFLHSRSNAVASTAGASTLHDRRPPDRRTPAIHDHHFLRFLLRYVLISISISVGQIKVDFDFDFDLSDVHMPDMDGFKLLELVGLEMDLPVIKRFGNIWQHVIRRKVESKSQSKSNNQQNPNHGAEGGQEAGSGDPNGKLNRKRKDEDEDVEDNGNEDDDPSSQKKPLIFNLL